MAIELGSEPEAGRHAPSGPRFGQRGTHTLVAGATGSGKTFTLAWITTLAICVWDVGDRGGPEG